MCRVLDLCSSVSVRLCLVLIGRLVVLAGCPIRACPRCILTPIIPFPVVLSEMASLLIPPWCSATRCGVLVLVGVLLCPLRRWCRKFSSPIPLASAMILLVSVPVTLVRVTRLSSPLVARLSVRVSRPIEPLDTVTLSCARCLCCQ